MTPLLDRAGVARRLSVSMDWIYRNIDRLDGFPPPVFGRGRGARWDPLAIDKWLALRRGDIAPAAPAAAADDLDVTAELRRRALALADARS